MFRKTVLTFLAAFLVVGVATAADLDKFSEYWLSRPPAVRMLADLPPASPARMQLARDLAKMGFVIDRAIDADGADPFETMKLRQEYGYTWVPGSFQAPISIAPGLYVPGLPSYDPDSPPAGSIAVATSWRPHPEKNPSPVFLRRGAAAEWSVRPGAKVSAGDRREEDRVLPDPFGSYVKARIRFVLTQWSDVQTWKIERWVPLE